MSIVRARVTGALWCALMCVSTSVAARERLAVVVFAPNDALLSDSLTEVAIARLAERNQHELVGIRELEANLVKSDSVASSNLEACISDADCLRHLGELASIKLILIGQLRQSATGGAQLEMRLADVDTAKPIGGSERARAGSEPEMIAAVQHCIDALFSSTPKDKVMPAARATSLHQAPITTVSRQKAAPLQTSTTLAHIRENKFAYGAASLAILSLSVAAFTGVVASGAPQGQTRLEAQADVERRNGYAQLTNGLLVTGAVLGTVSVCAFIWHW